MSEKKLEIDPVLLSVIQNSVTAGVNKGIEIAVKNINDEKEKNIKDKYDRKVRNTRLLLSNYRKFKKHIKETIYTEEQLSTATTVEILDKIYELNDDEKDDITVVQSILKSKKRTEIILNHIDNVISFYTFSAKKNKDIELQRRADVINKLYIEGKKMDHIADEINTSISTVKRDKNKAINEIAILMFRY